MKQLSYFSSGAHLKFNLSLGGYDNIYYSQHINVNRALSSMAKGHLLIIQCFLIHNLQACGRLLLCVSRTGVMSVDHFSEFKGMMTY